MTTDITNIDKITNSSVRNSCDVPDNSVNNEKNINLNIHHIQDTPQTSSDIKKISSILPSYIFEIPSSKTLKTMLIAYGVSHAIIKKRCIIHAVLAACSPYIYCGYHIIKCNRLLYFSLYK